MTEVRSEDEAFNKLFEMYEMDEFSLVDGDHEIGDNELVIDAINKVDIK
tara:strand:- start:876 stop:1022 length:147 start_codon:yes stop_codon:yes gene_type:complete